MKTVAEYRQYAADCRAIARGLKDPEEKRALEDMAAAWEKAADKRETELDRGVLSQVAAE
jgi:hypothetical protein